MTYAYTEEEYELLIDKTLETWRPIPFGWETPASWTVLWRHDVDYSPQRALALARIEASRSMKSTFFFQLRSSFYNILEPGMEKLLDEIARLGHYVGIHFDPAPYGNATREKLIECLRHEIEFFWRCFTPPLAFSMHNPTVCDKSFPVLAENTIEIPCADSPRFHDGVLYASDSRGGWRREDAPMIIARKSHDRLHILTHPERWTPAPENARGMLFRHLDGWYSAKYAMLEITARYWNRQIDENLDKKIQETIFSPRKRT